MRRAAAQALQSPRRHLGQEIIQGVAVGQGLLAGASQAVAIGQGRRAVAFEADAAARPELQEVSQQDRPGQEGPGVGAPFLVARVGQVGQPAAEFRKEVGDGLSPNTVHLRRIKQASHCR